jgi:hypothetical protein
MTLLFTSFACDYCDGLRDKPLSRANPLAFAWLALMLVDGNEVQAPEYERQRVEFQPFEVTGHLVGIGASWDFPVAASTWGVIGTATLMDAKTEGNALYPITMSCPRSILSGDRITFWHQFALTPVWANKLPRY